MMAKSEKEIKARMKKVLATAMAEFQIACAEENDWPSICVANMPNGNSEYFAIDDLSEDSVMQAIELSASLGAMNVVCTGLGTIMDTETLEEEEGICLIFVDSGIRYTMFQVFYEDEDFQIVSGRIIDLGKASISDDDFLRRNGFEP